MKKIKLSIIVPCYKVEKYLPRCLDSLVNQTLKDIEIICVNDCSPDNSLVILQEYAQKDNRIKIIDFKEALIFAFMGVLRVNNEINVLSSATGSSLDHSSGIIV